MRTARQKQAAEAGILGLPFKTTTRLALESALDGITGNYDVLPDGTKMSRREPVKSLYPWEVSEAQQMAQRAYNKPGEQQGGLVSQNEAPTDLQSNLAGTWRSTVARTAPGNITIVEGEDGKKNFNIKDVWDINDKTTHNNDLALENLKKGKLFEAFGQSNLIRMLMPVDRKTDITIPLSPEQEQYFANRPDVSDMTKDRFVVGDKEMAWRQQQIGKNESPVTYIERSFEDPRMQRNQTDILRYMDAVKARNPNASWGAGSTIEVPYVVNEKYRTLRNDGTPIADTEPKSGSGLPQPLEALNNFLLERKQGKPPESSPPPQKAKHTSYSVQAGDSLTAIARENGMSLDELLSLNEQYRNNPNIVPVGASLRLLNKTLQ